MKNNLDNLRKQIDLIDNQIIKLLAKRLKVAKKIGKWKKQKKLPLLDQNRWQKVLFKQMETGKILGINPNLIKKIYEMIHDEALKIEKSL